MAKSFRNHSIFITPLLLFSCVTTILVSVNRSLSCYIEPNRQPQRAGTTDVSSGDTTGHYTASDNSTTKYPISPVSEVLPKTLYLIYGLESSGTTFTARTIASAVGIQNPTGDFMQTIDNSIHVQHISLPTGWVTPDGFDYETQYTHPLPILPVVYPSTCQKRQPRSVTSTTPSSTTYYTRNKYPPKPIPTPIPCQTIMGSTILTSPNRYFVNISSHIHWYRERGVQVYPIMVVRDAMLHFEGILKSSGHCPNVTVAYQQFEQGRQIMIETMESNPPPIFVSYEALMTLQNPYLQHLYLQLGIVSSFHPTFRNGNTKHVMRDAASGNNPTSVQQELLYSNSQIDQDLMREDESIQSKSTLTAKSYTKLNREELLALIQQHRLSN